MVINELRLFIRNMLRENLYDVIRTKQENNKVSYYFNVDEYQYQVIFSPLRKDDGFYELVFKAKKEGGKYYDFDIMTNKNAYRVMQTISDIAEKFYNKRKNQVIEDLKRYNIEDKWNLIFKGFAFDLNSNDPKKDAQRLLLYKRYLSRYGFNIHKEDGFYYITK